MLDILEILVIIELSPHNLSPPNSTLFAALPSIRPSAVYIRLFVVSSTFPPPPLFHTISSRSPLCWPLPNFGHCLATLRGDCDYIAYGEKRTTDVWSIEWGKAILGHSWGVVLTHSPNQPGFTARLKFDWRFSFRTTNGKDKKSGEKGESKNVSDQFGSIRRGVDPGTGGSVHGRIANPGHTRKSHRCLRGKLSYNYVLLHTAQHLLLLVGN